VFYLSHSETEINSVAHYSLNLNSFDEDEGYTNFTDGGTNSWFVTNPLGIDSFYATDYNFYIEACAEKNNETESAGQIDLSLKILHSDGDMGDTICETHTSISTVDSCSVVSNYQIYPISCSAGDITLSPTDSLLLVASDGSHAITYYLKMDGNSRIEVGGGTL